MARTRSFQYKYLIFMAFLAACATSRDRDTRGSERAGSMAKERSRAADAGPKTQAEPEKPKSPREVFVAWLGPRLPKGGEIVDEPPAPVKVVHVTSEGESARDVGKAYLDLSQIYLLSDVQKAIEKAHPESRMRPFKAGVRVEIPGLLERPYPPPDKGRLGWPKDRSLRGVYLGGVMTGKHWIPTLDRVRARGMNAVVLDGKDYMGPVNYPSSAKVSKETGADAKAPMLSLARTIRFAHDRGIRVIMRDSCFHDPWAAKHAPRLSIQGDWGKPFPMGWMDPVNKEAQDYILELVREQIEAGVDEIQLDYIRFPVHKGLKRAVIPPAENGARITAIRDVVRRVHSVTQPKGIPLSLDIFGVVSTGTRQDIESLGQDIAVLGGEAEVLSPMVYPSHYHDGFQGYPDPANHPEVVAFGTKAAVDILKKAGHKDTIIRPWLQAFGWKTPSYGPEYVRTETQSAIKGGAVGWLLWDPGCGYGAAWRGLPIVNPAGADAGGSATAK